MSKYLSQSGIVEKFGLHFGDVEADGNFVNYSSGNRIRLLIENMQIMIRKSQCLTCNSLKILLGFRNSLMKIWKRSYAKSKCLYNKLFLLHLFP